MLQEVDSSKYLGVTISKDRRWDDHINTITAKANRTLSFIRRNMRGCKSSARAAAYQGLVRPTLEYTCSTARASMTTSDVNNQCRSNFQQQIINYKKMHSILIITFKSHQHLI
jgi:hypothetical protein